MCICSGSITTKRLPCHHYYTAQKINEGGTVAVGAAATQYCPLHCTLFEDDGAKKHIHLFTFRDSLFVLNNQGSKVTISSRILEK